MVGIEGEGMAFFPLHHNRTCTHQWILGVVLFLAVSVTNEELFFIYPNNIHQRDPGLVGSDFGFVLGNQVRTIYPKIDCVLKIWPTFISLGLIINSKSIDHPQVAC